MNRRLLCVALLLVGIACVGCKPPTRAEAKKYPVSGTVTLDGNPMPDGEIYFKTVQIGALDIVPIKDGKFQGQAQSGARTVEIYSFREGMSEEAKKMYGDKAPPGMGTSKENIIPAKWNAESKLTAEVKETGANEFKFEITAK